MTAQLVKLPTAIEPLPIPWNYRRIPVIGTKNLDDRRNSFLHRNRTCRLRAEAKGFNRASIRLQSEGENALATDSNNENNRRKGGGGGGDDEKIPDVALKRIIWRVLFYVGAPLATGVLLLQVLGAVRDVGGVDVPKWLGLLAIFITFGASALGIAYGSLSASWDADREGSFLGFEEDERNWVDMWGEDED